LSYTEAPSARYARDFPLLYLRMSFICYAMNSPLKLNVAREVARSFLSLDGGASPHLGRSLGLT